MTAHEHCEEVLGKPACDHYLRLPVYSGYEGRNALLERPRTAWLRQAPLRRLTGR